MFVSICSCVSIHIFGEYSWKKIDFLVWISSSDVLFNIGVIWSEEDGLKVLIDGVDYGTYDPYGEEVNKVDSQSSPYVVLGRFSDDDDSHWLTPAEASAKAATSQSYEQPPWEMSNSVFKDITYFGKKLTEEEYTRQTGLLGIIHFRGFNGRMWFGEGLVDADQADLSLAAQIGVARPGPFVRSEMSGSMVKWLETNRAFELAYGAGLRLGILNPTDCPADLSKCSKGFSIGGWMRVGGPDYPMSNAKGNGAIILFTGSDGEFGLSLSLDSRHLYAWVSQQDCQAENDAFSPERQNMQWMHFGIVWDKAERESNVTVFINGQKKPCRIVEPNLSNSRKTAQDLFNWTNSSSSHLLISSENLTEIGANLSVALLGFTEEVYNNLKIMNLMGISYSQLLRFRSSTFYWPFGGIIKRLGTDRLTPVTVTYTLDNMDTPLGAMCTDGTNRSYILVRGDRLNNKGKTNMDNLCLFNTEPGCGYVFIIEFTVPGIDSLTPGVLGELFRSQTLTGSAGVAGLQLKITPEEPTYLTIVCSKLNTLTYRIALSALGKPGEWVRMKLTYWNREATINVNGKNVTAKPTVLSDQFILKPDSNAQFTVSLGLKTCISSISLLEYSDLDVLNRLNHDSVQHCYPTVDINLLPEPTIFQIASKTGPQCLLDPEKCATTGMTFSLWLKIDKFASNDNKGDTVLVTGEGTTKGVKLTLYESSSGTVGMLDVECTIRRSTAVWSVRSLDAVLLNVSTNIGVSWIDSLETNSMTLEIYVNGTKQFSSTIPNTTEASSPNTNNEVKFPSKSSGTMHNLAFWSSKAVVCSKPRDTQQKLMGSCYRDQQTALSATCVALDNCKLAKGAVCLDQTLGAEATSTNKNLFAAPRTQVYVDHEDKRSSNPSSMEHRLTNLARMAKQSQRVSDPADFLALIRMVDNYLDNTVAEETSQADLSNLVWLSTKIYNTWPKILGSACTNRNSSYCGYVRENYLDMIEMVGRIGGSLSDLKFEQTWSALIAEEKLEREAIINAVESVMMGIGMVLDSPEPCLVVNKRTIDGTYFASLIRANNKNDNCTQQTEIVVSSYTESCSSNCHSAEFSIPATVVQSDISSKGIASLVALPGPVITSTVVVGGLGCKNFPDYVLKPKLNTEHIRLANSSLSLRSALADATELSINSPLYLLTTTATDDNMSLTKLGSNVRLRFVVEMIEPNEYRDVYYYLTTGRKKWKSEMAKNSNAPESQSLAFPVRCVFWNFDSRGFWDDNGCAVIGANLTHVHCTCTHMSLFAIAKEPSDAPGRKDPIWKLWGSADASQNELLIKIILIAFNIVSEMFSLLLFCTFLIFNIRFGAENLFLIHNVLAAAYVLLHLGLLLLPFMDHLQTGCQSLGLLINIGGVVSTSGLMCESIVLFNSFVLGDLTNKRTWIGMFLFGIPVIVVIVPAVVSHMDEHGGDLLCLPSHESYAFWIMFGVMFFFLLVALVICMIISCNLETPAYLRLKVLETLLNRIDHIDVMVLFTVMCWVVFVIVVKIPMPYLPYITYICISLQGTLSYFLTALDDVEVMGFYRGKMQKQKSVNGLNNDNVSLETSIYQAGENGDNISSQLDRKLSEDGAEHTVHRRWNVDETQ
ncbi:unnamed protein product [Calicophoron daubneyi]|uniref:GAIN-B domain-containing protein n=2 Tax=Calicophoron daubneyi TaxID=300641 RepID=A0AAV2TGW0_CALDB